MRFLPMESHPAPHQASTAAVYQSPIPHSCLLPQRPTIPTLLSPPPPPLLICLPLSGQRHPPQTEHSGGPLGDPSARVFEVFLIVSQSVSTFLNFCQMSQVTRGANCPIRSFPPITWLPSDWHSHWRSGWVWVPFSLSRCPPSHTYRGVSEGHLFSLSQSTFQVFTHGRDITVFFW